MAVINIKDIKDTLPPILKVTVGRKATFYKVKTTDLVYNKPVV